MITVENLRTCLYGRGMVLLRALALSAKLKFHRIYMRRAGHLSHDFSFCRVKKCQIVSRPKLHLFVSYQWFPTRQKDFTFKSFSS